MLGTIIFYTEYESHIFIIENMKHTEKKTEDTYGSEMVKILIENILIPFLYIPATLPIILCMYMFTYNKIGILF